MDAKGHESQHLIPFSETASDDVQAKRQSVCAKASEPLPFTNNYTNLIPFNCELMGVEEWCKIALEENWYS